MIKLLVGHKGSGKTKQMIDLANERVESTLHWGIYLSSSKD